MEKTGLAILFTAMLMIASCGNSETGETSNAEPTSPAVQDAYSLSAELNTAADSIDAKVQQLQTTLENLNN